MKDIELYYDDCFEIMKKLIADGRKVDAIIMTSVKPQSTMSPAGCKRVSI